MGRGRVRQGIPGGLFYLQGAVAYLREYPGYRLVHLGALGQVVFERRPGILNLALRQYLLVYHGHPGRPPVQDRRAAGFHQGHGFLESGFANAVVHRVDFLPVGEGPHFSSKVFGLQVDDVREAPTPGQALFGGAAHRADDGSPERAAQATQTSLANGERMHSPGALEKMLAIFGKSQE